MNKIFFIYKDFNVLFEKVSSICFKLYAFHTHPVKGAKICIYIIQTVFFEKNGSPFLGNRWGILDRRIVTAFP